VRLALLSMAIGVCLGGCSWPAEAIHYSYDVRNYSPNRYFVSTTLENGMVYWLASPADSTVYNTTPAKVQQSRVYNEDCSAELATVTYPAGVSDLVIGVSGAVSVPDAPLGRPTQADPSIGRPYPMASGCRQK
jgi:hypothetical protein